LSAFALLQPAAPQKPYLCEVAPWDIAYLGSCHLGNCHLGSRSLENAFGKNQSG